MRSFDQIRHAFPWEEIPGCPGRYRLTVPMPDTCPVDLAGNDAQVEHLKSSTCRDAIELVLLTGGGGLLSYRRADGSYVHTLNTGSGLERKLAQLRLAAPHVKEPQLPPGTDSGAG